MMKVTRNEIPDHDQEYPTLRNSTFTPQRDKYQQEPPSLRQRQNLELSNDPRNKHLPLCASFD